MVSCQHAILADAIRAIDIAVFSLLGFSWDLASYILNNEKCHPLRVFQRQWCINYHKSLKGAVFEYRKDIITASTFKCRLIARSFQFEGNIDFNLRCIKRDHNDEIRCKVPGNKKILIVIGESKTSFVKTYYRNMDLSKNLNKETITTRTARIRFFWFNTTF